MVESECDEKVSTFLSNPLPLFHDMAGDVANIGNLRCGNCKCKKEKIIRLTLISTAKLKYEVCLQYQSCVISLMFQCHKNINSFGIVNKTKRLEKNCQQHKCTHEIVLFFSF